MEPFIGNITMFGGNFAPRGWALCNGQLLSINQNQALFSILGTTYGGDGRTTFALPDLRGRTPINQGQGPGLTNRPLGSKSGSETETLTVNQLPSHNHSLNAEMAFADKSNPTNKRMAYHSGYVDENGTANDERDLNTKTIGNTGGGQPHNNIQPVLVINYIIALTGVFPSRN